MNLHGIFAAVDEAVLAAQAAQREWIRLPVETRKACIEAALELALVTSTYC